VLFSDEKHQIIPFLKRVLFTHPNEGDEIILNRMVTLGMAQGFMGGILGTIHVMSHLEEPWQIGKGLALMVLCLLYGIYPTMLVLFRLKQSIQGKMGGYMLVVLPLMFFFDLYGV
jgi:flagellar motor component MotA